MADKFVNLHNHCEYSLLDGFGTPEQYIQRAKDLGQTAIGITDHGNVSSHYKWYSVCKKNGLKPVLGCEMYIVDDIRVLTRNRYHITMLAKNLTGLQNLYRLVTFSYQKGFYYKPRIDWEALRAFKDGIIITSGCPSSEANMAIRTGKDLDVVADEISRQRAIVGEDNYYIELSPWSFAEGITVGVKMHHLATTMKIPMVMTMDCHYPLKEQAKLQEMLLCIQTASTMDNPKRMKFDQDDFYLKDAVQMEKEWKKIHPDLDISSAIAGSLEIADKVSFDFPTTSPVVFPADRDKAGILREMCTAAMQKRGLIEKQEYKDRLERELSLIDEKKFVDYFLVIIELISWARQQGILVGIGRGSSAGSLVCWLTGITMVDPLRFGLLFERFIDVNRSDLPDIDIDFQEDRRMEVKRHLEEKYGEDKVASFVTYTTFGSKMCFQDIGRIFKLPRDEVEKMKNFVIKRSGGDSRFGFSVEDTFATFEQAREILKKYPQLEYAKHFEGRVRNMSQHAAGIIISNDPINNFAALYQDKEGQNVVSLQYDDVEKLGALKIDILGLTALSTIDSVMKSIKKIRGESIVLEEIPLDDPEVYKMFCDGMLAGIFQFEGFACAQVCRQVLPGNFDELVAVNALARPGSLHSGGTNSYVERKHGRKEITYEHPMLEPILKETFGVACYQEQVMIIVKQIGNFSWKDTSTIRKIMSKNVGVEAFGKFEEKFLAGAAANGVEKDIALKIWQSIFTFGSWAFNKSHAVCYSMMAYHMMWFKVHYPLEFFSNLLRTEADGDKRRNIMREYQKMNGRILPISINRSDVFSSIDDNALRLGLSDAKGVGVSVARKIIEKRPWTSVTAVLESAGTVAEILLRVGACADLPYDDLSLFAGKDDNGVKFSFDYKNPSKADMHKFCPFLEPIDLYERWAPVLRKAYPKMDDFFSIDAILNIEKQQNAIIVAVTDSTKVNYKNKVDEASFRGRPFTMKEGTKKEEYDYADVAIDDGTATAIVRVGNELLPKYKDFLWSIGTETPLIIKIFAKPNMNVVFAREIKLLASLKCVQQAMAQKEQSPKE